MALPLHGGDAQRAERVCYLYVTGRSKKSDRGDEGWGRDPLPYGHGVGHWM